MIFSQPVSSFWSLPTFLVDDIMNFREGRQVRNEEQVVEQLDGIGLVVLLEFRNI